MNRVRLRDASGDFSRRLSSFFFGGFDALPRLSYWMGDQETLWDRKKERLMLCLRIFDYFFFGIMVIYAYCSLCYTEAYDAILYYALYKFE